MVVCHCPPSRLPFLEATSFWIHANHSTDLHDISKHFLTVSRCKASLLCVYSSAWAWDTPLYFRKQICAYLCWVDVPRSMFNWFWNMTLHGWDDVRRKGGLKSLKSWKEYLCVPDWDDDGSEDPVEVLATLLTSASSRTAIEGAIGMVEEGLVSSAVVDVFLWAWGTASPKSLWAAWNTVQLLSNSCPKVNHLSLSRSNGRSMPVFWNS